MSSVIFHVIIILFLIAIIALLIIGFFLARTKVRDVEGRVEAVIARVNDVYGKVSSIDVSGITSHVNELAGKLDAVCGKELPFGIGRLC